MIKSLMLTWYGSYGGGAIGDMLSQWEQAGFFQYLLPFLLIFALVFGILDRVEIFKNNKSINGIIALVVGLMAIQFPIVSQFFAEIFPRLGIALSIILVMMILLGLFLDKEENGVMNWVLLGIVVIIFIIVLVSTAGSLGWSSGWWWQDNWPMVAGVVFILAVIGLIVGSASKEKKGFTPIRRS